MPRFSETAKAIIFMSLGAIFLGDAGGEVILEIISTASEQIGQMFTVGGGGMERAGDAFMD